MILMRPTNPIKHDYNGDALVIPDLRRYCEDMNGNMTNIESQFQQLFALIAQERKLNAQLVDFATWVIAQDPKALHEYKAVATTLTALEGRDPDGQVQAQSAP